jgi:YrbI family 3-deoxy-D-manno-octulosonate 8-phosphate phosphatase
MKNKIKLFVADIDGTLTDGTVFYSVNGEELKQFSHRDGRAFHLLHHNTNCKTCLITTEVGGINQARANKFKKLGTLDYFFDGACGEGKAEIVRKLCEELKISPDEVMFIGDDTNDQEVLEYVGYPVLVADANPLLFKEIKNIFYVCGNKGGKGAVREIVDYIIEKGFVEVI